MQVKETFRKYIEEAIGQKNADIAFSAFDCEASVSVRMNPFKRPALPISWDDSREVKWCREGRMLSKRPSFTLDPYMHAGAYYVQDSSSMFVGHLFRSLIEKDFSSEHGTIRVLDLCAAPGGKTTDIASSLRQAFGDGFLLVSNEVMSSRAGILADNVALWGDPNVVVTSEDPAAFSSLRDFFDIIVTDVPCSGEGMFRKDEQACQQWSEDNVSLCAARQKRIIADVWPSLRESGILVYSTCTFNRHENDDNVAWIADELGAEFLSGAKGGPGSLVEDFQGILVTDFGYSLVPGLVEGEGQYCAALRKSGPGPSSFCGRYDSGNSRVRRNDNAALPHFGNLFDRDVVLRTKGEMMTAVPSSIAQDVKMIEGSMRVLSAGCAVGVMKGRDLVPSADLALSTMLSETAYPSVDVDLQDALSFLHRDALVFRDAPKGYLLVRYGGLPLGFVKNIGTRCNNLHPQSRRIRMDINR